MLDLLESDVAAAHLAWLDAKATAGRPFYLLRVARAAALLAQAEQRLAGYNNYEN